MQFIILRNSEPKFYLKMGHFGFSWFIKNNLRFVDLIDEKSYAKKASHTA